MRYYYVLAFQHFKPILKQSHETQVMSFLIPKFPTHTVVISYAQCVTGYK